MAANQSNLTPEQRLEAMVYKVAPWAPNPAEFNKATTQIALSLLKRLDAVEAQVKELERELTRHHKASVKHVAELQSERDAALKARDEAADQVMELRDALKHEMVCRECGEMGCGSCASCTSSGAISNTCAHAAQRKREIQREAVELPSRVPPPGCERGWMINQNMPDTLKVGWSSDHTIPPGTIEFWQDGKLKGRIDGIGIHAVFKERVKP